MAVQAAVEIEKGNAMGEDVAVKANGSKTTFSGLSSSSSSSNSSNQCSNNPISSSDREARSVTLESTVMSPK